MVLGPRGATGILVRRHGRWTMSLLVARSRQSRLRPSTAGGRLLSTGRRSAWSTGDRANLMKPTQPSHTGLNQLALKPLTRRPHMLIVSVPPDR